MSLDAPLTPGEDNKLLDYLPDTQNPGPDSETFEHALTESIEEVLSTLKEREAKILRLYFGLDGPEHTPSPEFGNETTGVVFDPSGTRMYFSSQRSYPFADRPAGAPRAVASATDLRSPARPTPGSPPAASPRPPSRSRTELSLANE